MSNKCSRIVRTVRNANIHNIWVSNFLILCNFLERTHSLRQFGFSFILFSSFSFIDGSRIITTGWWIIWIIAAVIGFRKCMEHFICYSILQLRSILRNLQYLLIFYLLLEPLIIEQSISSSRHLILQLLNLDHQAICVSK